MNAPAPHSQPFGSGRRSGHDKYVPDLVRGRFARALVPPHHALQPLTAFKRDATQLRYVDWEDLLDYCRYSAMPVGRFVLDVHGERRDTWPANDALCAALQIINHLQDCGEDYRNLDRRIFFAELPLPSRILRARKQTMQSYGLIR